MPAAGSDGGADPSAAADGGADPSAARAPNVPGLRNGDRPGGPAGGAPPAGRGHGRRAREALSAGADHSQASPLPHSTFATSGVSAPPSATRRGGPSGRRAPARYRGRGPRARAQRSRELLVRRPRLPRRPPGRAGRSDGLGGTATTSGAAARRPPPRRSSPRPATPRSSTTTGWSSSGSRSRSYAGWSSSGSRSSSYGRWSSSGSQSSSQTAGWRRGQGYRSAPCRQSTARPS